MIFILEVIVILECAGGLAWGSHVGRLPEDLVQYAKDSAQWTPGFEMQKCTNYVSVFL